MPPERVLVSLFLTPSTCAGDRCALLASTAAAVQHFPAACSELQHLLQRANSILRTCTDASLPLCAPLCDACDLPSAPGNPKVPTDYSSLLFPLTSCSEAGPLFTDTSLSTLLLSHVFPLFPSPVFSLPTHDHPPPQQLSVGEQRFSQLDTGPRRDENNDDGYDTTKGSRHSSCHSDGIDGQSSFDGAMTIGNHSTGAQRCSGGSSHKPAITYHTIRDPATRAATQPQPTSLPACHSVPNQPDFKRKLWVAKGPRN